jgi:hypothetical protein
MTGVTRIPRRRGSLCGLLLVLLGAWGGLAPFVGPYFKFAFTPDKAWAYTQGRLYLSIVPGAAALLGGLLVLITRSRALGVIGGLLAAAGGAWLVAGQGVTATLLRRPSITIGTPITRGGAVFTGSTSTYQELELLAFFAGLGILIAFFGALAIGRFSVPGAADEASYGDGDYLDADADQPATMADQYTASSTSTSQFPTGQRPFPGEEPTQTQDRFPSVTGQFPATPTGRFPESSSPFGSD